MTLEHTIVLGIPVIHYEKVTVDGLLNLMGSGLVRGFCSVESALLPWGRNVVIHQTYINQPDFTHLLFIDDDMAGFHAEHLKRLIEADKDVISALMVQRKAPHKVVTSFIDTDPTIKEIQEGKLREANHTGMAFTLIKRAVLDAVVENTTEGQIWFSTDRPVRNGFDSEVKSFIDENIENRRTGEAGALDLQIILSDAIMMGRTAHLGAPLNGEDIGFCKKAKLLGFEVWCDLGCQVLHVGNKGFSIVDNIEQHPPTENIKPELIKC